MKITPIHTGYLKLDGGAMFGVVPRRMWEQLNPPDGNNMCSWAMRALLVETGSRKILIDTGIGNKQDDKFRAHFEPFGAENLFDSLAAAGCSREAVTDVFLTHLHFDHCGGALWKNPETGAVEFSFPNAVYWSNAAHYAWASQPNMKEKASFLPENFQPLMAAGRLQFVDVRQNVEFVPGFQVRFFYGHTEAMMAPVLQTEKGKILYCADTIPSQWHLGLPYIMAYDVRPLLSLEEKTALLKEALDEQMLLFLEHDPLVEACRVQTDAKGRVALGAAGPLSALCD
ncbi:MAG: MBL fold metallo-hydrolase [Saprospiraceae bacterium]|nr:MBL fold metallo-hydrolase [Saprospiraceae bacterium]